MTPRRIVSTWFASLVVLGCMYAPLFILFLSLGYFRFDDDVRQTFHLIVLYPGLAVAGPVARVFGMTFYFVFEILGIVGAIWLARRSVIWLVGISIGALILSLFNIREMLRWG